MPTMLSPKVAVVEKDYSTIIPVVSTGIGAVAGRFTKGPIQTPVLISTEDELVDTFGIPNDTNSNEWFVTSQFLQYANKIWVVRVGSDNDKNSTTSGTGVAILNEDQYSTMLDADKVTAGEFIARAPGTSGNSIGIILYDAQTFDEVSTWCTTNKNLFPNKVTPVDMFNSAPSETTWMAALHPSDTTSREDEVYAVVIDMDGRLTGTPYTVLERFEGMSKAFDAVAYNGDSLYYVNVINNNSKYLWWTGHPTQTSAVGDIAFGSSGFNAAATGKKFAALSVAAAPNFYLKTLAGGAVGTTTTVAQMKNGYDLFLNTDLYDVNLILTGAPNIGTQGELASYIVSNIAAVRKDSIAFVTPYASGGKPFLDTDTTKPVVSLPAFRTTMNLAEAYASYSFFDTGFKYIYDRYNNKYRWVPLNGDIAGLCARTDDVADPWYSPAGNTRGGIKNVVRLSFNPREADRDVLYPKGFNPVVSFPGQGPTLWGDRTGALKPSAFDRINVRRLFMVLEKAIAVAAKYQLFEFNDSFTRAQFRNMIEPYLRNIQGRRGITDFQVVCDTTNNTGEIIDSNQFVADIYIKPNRSINFITLSFVATRTDVSFSTVIGG